jgi:general stress protein 26
MVGTVTAGDQPDPGATIGGWSWQTDGFAASNTLGPALSVWGPWLHGVAPGRRGPRRSWRERLGSRAPPRSQSKEAEVSAEQVVHSILDQPIVAIVATGGGWPHAVPVWFRYDVASRRILVWSDRSRHWVRRIQANDAVSVVVAQSVAPFGAVVIRGRAKLVHDNVLDEAAKICNRYLPPGDVTAYVQQWATLDTLVAIECGTIRAWSRGY